MKKTSLLNHILSSLRRNVGRGPIFAFFLSLMPILAILAASGCGKSEQAPQKAPGQVVDMAALRQAFPTPSPEIAQSLDQVQFGVRYGDFGKALAELDKLASNGTLTEPQKKAVAELTAQVKQMQGQTAPPSPPTQ